MGGGQLLVTREYPKGIIFALIEAFILINWRYFYKGFWGVITLGVTPGVGNDHSVFLLIQGLIAILIFTLFLIAYALNIKAAITSGKKLDTGEGLPTTKRYLKELWHTMFPYILMTPGTVFIAFTILLPLLFGICIAFTNYAMPVIPPKRLLDWVGFKNFGDIFTLVGWKDTFFGVAAWTTVWAVVATITCFASGLFVAILVNNKKIKFAKFWRTIYILPWAVPQFISLLIMRNIFNAQFGPINVFLKSHHIIEKNIPWLTDPTLAKVMIVVINMWVGFPYFMALTSGVMTSISDEIYEAARIDGANAQQEFFGITLPMVLFATAPLLISNFALNFNNFNVIYLLNEGNPANSAYRYAGHTDILISWLYKLTVEQNRYNMAAVMSIMIFIVIGSISAYNFTHTKSFKEEDMM